MDVLAMDPAETERRQIFEMIRSYYADKDEFSLEEAYRYLQISTPALQPIPVPVLDYFKFRQIIDDFVALRLISTGMTAAGSIVYRLGYRTAPRAGISDTLTSAMDSIRTATRTGPATIAQVAASRQSNHVQMIRSAIDILTACGIVKQYVGHPKRFVWDRPQEIALRNIHDTTSEYYRLTTEIKNLDWEILEVITTLNDIHKEEENIEFLEFQ
jgi:hypothetical protein